MLCFLENFSSFLYIMSIFVYIFWLKVGGVWEWVHLLCFGYYSEDHLHPCTLSLFVFRAEMNLVKAADSWLYVFLIHTDSMCFLASSKTCTFRVIIDKWGISNVISLFLVALYIHFCFCNFNLVVFYVFISFLFLNILCLYSRCVLWLSWALDKISHR